MNQYYFVQFAQAYGQSTYGSCTYSDTTSCATATGSTSTGTLTNTGVMVGAFVGIACLIVVVALVVRFWRRPSKHVPVAVLADQTPPPEEEKPPLTPPQPRIQ